VVVISTSYRLETAVSP